MIFRNLLTQLSSLVLSFFLAILVWGVATNEENPSHEALFTDPVPVEYTNRADGLTMTEQSADRVRVQVRTSEANWQTLRVESFQAVADLHGMDAGSHSVPVVVTAHDPQVTVLSVDPPSIDVKLERVAQVTMDVRTRILDDPPLGYEYKNIAASPSRVTISGPESAVAQVADATADLALRGAKTAVDRDVAISLHDAQGNPVQNLSVSPQTTTVHIDVVQRVGYKEVAVKAVLRGTPSSGYWVSDIRVDPPTVTLLGSQDALDKIPGFVEAQPVSVTSAHEDVIKQVGLNLAPGISAFNATSVNVHVSVEPLLGGITIRRVVSVSELRCEMPVTVSPDTVEVILSGPLPILQSLTADDVQIVVDVNGCSPSTFQATPRWVNVPDSLKVESIVPNTVEVNVKPQ